MYMFFSIMVCYKILNIVPCAIQQDLVVYPSYIKQFASANPRLPILPSLTTLMRHSLWMLTAFSSVTQSCPTNSLRPHGLQTDRLLHLWDCSGKNTGVGCHFLLPGEDCPGGPVGKASVYSTGDPGLIPGWGRASGKENGKPLQFSCLENPMHGGAWQAIQSIGSQRVRHD